MKNRHIKSSNFAALSFPRARLNFLTNYFPLSEVHSNIANVCSYSLFVYLNIAAVYIYGAVVCLYNAIVYLYRPLCIYKRRHCLSGQRRCLYIRSRYLPGKRHCLYIQTPLYIYTEPLYKGSSGAFMETEAMYNSNNINYISTGFAGWTGYNPDPVENLVKEV